MPPSWWPLVPVLLTAGGLLVGIGVGWGTIREISRRLDAQVQRLEHVLPDVAVLKDRMAKVDGLVPAVATLQAQVQAMGQRLDRLERPAH